MHRAGNYREAGQTALNILKNVKAELGLRAGLELICAVRGADSDCKRNRSRCAQQIP